MYFIIYLFKFMLMGIVDLSSFESVYLFYFDFFERRFNSYKLVCIMPPGFFNRSRASSIGAQVLIKESTSCPRLLQTVVLMFLGLFHRMVRCLEAIIFYPIWPLKQDDWHFEAFVLPYLQLLYRKISIWRLLCLMPLSVLNRSRFRNSFLYPLLPSTH